MLKELSVLKAEAEEAVTKNFDVELDFSDDARKRILDLYQEQFPAYSASLQNGLIKISNKDGQTAYLPLNWFSRIRNCRALIEALKDYSTYAEELKNILDDSVMRTLPKINWKTKIPQEDVQLIENFINNTFDKNEDRTYFSAFLDGRVWLNVKADQTVLSGKKLNRTSIDYISSCITTICKFINDTAGKLDHFIELYLRSNEVRDIVDGQSLVAGKISKAPNLTLGSNIIYYGAPGTGKSHTVDSRVSNNISIRTVFHPDTQYSDFVGSLKPKTSTDINGNPRISYEFRAGPFTTAFIKALQKSDSGEHIYLIIEELNRAPASAVFGELFQLLDRKLDGESKYEINVSDPDLLEYINKAIAPNSIKNLTIPKNMTILATMNSSDQAVMPMDTAFKRRWSFEYTRIDYKNASQGSLTLNTSLPGATNSIVISWARFAEIINNKLKSFQIPEDRLLGHRFLSDSELKDEITAKQTLSGKLFVYLWDDILRHGDRNAIFNTESFTTFGDLTAAFLKYEPIFSKDINDELDKAAEIEDQLAKELEEEEGQEE